METLDRPLCRCHGEAMYTNGRHPSGRRAYRCSVKTRADVRGRGLRKDPAAARRDALRYLARQRERLSVEDLAAFEEARRDAVRRWYAENGLAYTRKRRASRTPEEAERDREYVRAWKRTPEGRAAVQASNERRRARKAGAAVNDFGLDPHDRETLLLEYGDRCLYCGTSEDLTLDHDVPISRGGDHTWRNLVPLCALCNSRKGTRTGAEYERRRLTE